MTKVAIGVFALALVAGASAAIGAASIAPPAPLTDDFEGPLNERWVVSGGSYVRTAPSNDPAHGKVLALEPGGDDVYASAASTIWRCG